MLIYSLKDVKASSFSFPFQSVTDATAIRLVQDELLNRHSLVSQHPEDFVLYSLGSFDPVSGLIQSHDPRFVADCSGLYLLASVVEGGNRPSPSIAKGDFPPSASSSAVSDIPF